MRIALAGNPNSGKTTMYNALTGSNEKVGNWAGVTVDKKEHPIKKSIFNGSVFFFFNTLEKMFNSTRNNTLFFLNDVNIKS